MKEYIIWGKSVIDGEERLLMDKYKGEYITDKSQAEELVKILTCAYDFIDCRIQEIDLNNVDINKMFIKSINGGIYSKNQTN